MQNPDPPIRRYLAILRRQAWLVLLVPAVTLLTAALINSQLTTIYRAEMGIVTVQAGGEVQPEFGSQALLQTMSSLLHSEVVARRAIEQLGLQSTPKEVLKRLKTHYEPNSSVLELTFDSSERARGVLVLATIASVFEKLVDEKLGVQSGNAALRGGAKLPVVVATVFDPAHSQSDPISPKPVRTLGFAGALGLVLGAMLAFARESIDSRIRSRAEAEEPLRARVAGTLPKGARGKPPPGVEGARRRADATLDALQLLRANLEASQTGTGGPTILVTSATAGDGKTTVAAHLGASLALARQHVICVDADLRRPSLHRYFGLDPAAAGLTELLAGEIDVDEALRPVRLVDPRLSQNSRGPARSSISESEAAATQNPIASSGSLHVVTAGRAQPNPDALLTPGRVAELMALLRSEAPYVILDAAPLLRLADSYPLVLSSDTVLAVVRLGRTTRQEAEGIRSILDGLGAQNVSIVLTDGARDDGYGYG